MIKKHALSTSPHRALHFPSSAASPTPPVSPLLFVTPLRVDLPSPEPRRASSARSSSPQFMLPLTLIYSPSPHTSRLSFSRGRAIASRCYLRCFIRSSPHSLSHSHLSPPRLQPAHVVFLPAYRSLSSAQRTPQARAAHSFTRALPRSRVSRMIHAATAALLLSLSILHTLEVPSLSLSLSLSLSE